MDDEENVRHNSGDCKESGQACSTSPYKPQYSAASAAVREESLGVEALKVPDSSSDTKSVVISRALLFDSQFDEDYGVDQWGNEWESDAD